MKHAATSFYRHLPADTSDGGWGKHATSADSWTSRQACRTRRPAHPPSYAFLWPNMRELVTGFEIQTNVDLPPTRWRVDDAAPPGNHASRAATWPRLNNHSP